MNTCKCRGAFAARYRHQMKEERLPGVARCPPASATFLCASLDKVPWLASRAAQPFRCFGVAHNLLPTGIPANFSTGTECDVSQVCHDRGAVPDFNIRGRPLSRSNTFNKILHM